MARAVDGEIKMPGSSLAADNFFFYLLLPHLRKAKKLRICGRRTFFSQKKLRIFLKLYYINCRYDRRFTDHLRPPHFWQTSSNYGSLGSSMSIIPMQSCPSGNMYRCSLMPRSNKLGKFASREKYTNSSVTTFYG